MKGLQLKYFVLSPHSTDYDHGKASRRAMISYAREINKTNPQLAEDIRRWVIKAEVEAGQREADTVVCKHCGYPH
jgi:hypothetical protein